MPHMRNEELPRPPVLSDDSRDVLRKKHAIGAALTTAVELDLLIRAFCTTARMIG